VNPPAEVAIQLPHMGYAALMPLLVVFGAAVLSVFVEAFLPRVLRRPTQVVLCAAALVVAVVFLGVNAGEHTVAAAGAIAVDGVTQFIQGTIALLALLCLLLIAEREAEPGGAFTPEASTTPGSAAERRVGALHSHTEVFPLFLFAVGGMMLFPAANDLLTLFVALEVLSLPLYLLCGMARRRRLLSQEAAMKYLLLGSVSSAILLFGIALLYGYAGTLNFGPHLSADGSRVLPGLAEVISTQTANQPLLYGGAVLILVGLLFKVGAVPFHLWTPDVYEGAPTPITALMAAGTKVAAVAALLRMLYVVLGGLRWDYAPLLWGVAIVTMLGGAVLALTQTDVKRMLAYSSIAHAGFLLVGLAATSSAGTAAVLFYLVAYGFVSVGAFALLTVVRSAAGEATHLSQWAGLGRRSPLVAGLFGLFLLAMAGIPLTSGFTSKFAVFQAAAQANATWLVVVAVAASVLTAFFYLRVVVMMFFAPRGADAATVVVPSGLTVAAIACAAVVTIVLGLAPQAVLTLANHATTLLR
jgi:NADH-quinone oxidoreductase subunit N